MKTLEDFCSAHDLQLLERLPNRAGASLFIARVRTNAGTELVLKKTSPATGAREIAVLKATSGAGATVDFIREIEPGTYLMEWLSGRSLAEVPNREVIDVRGLGMTIRAFHGLDPPRGLPLVKRGFFARRAGDWRELSSDLRDRGNELSDWLDARTGSTPVFLHGDLVPGNVLVTESGLRLIDPTGLLGPAAWDIAQLVVTSLGRGRGGLLRPLLDGYGGTPAHLAETTAWMALHYLDKNLAVVGSAFTPNLAALADSVGAASDLQVVLHRLLR